MTDIAALINRIDQELEVEVKREKVAWRRLKNRTGYVKSVSSATRAWLDTSSRC
jgi:hypothetical protein